MVQIHDESLSPVTGRIMGILLLFAGVAAAAALCMEWSEHVARYRSAASLAFLGVGGFLSAIATLQGARMAFAPRRSSLSLPNAMLWLGVVLFFALGIGQIILSLVAPAPYWSLLSGVVFGLGGSLGAFQLFHRRRRGEPDPPQAE
jgi:hypothetical protein